MHAAVMSLTLLVAVGPTLAGHPDPDRVLRVDAVELLAGREVAGLETNALTRGDFVYWFASPRTKAAFEADPQRYEIADGGACGRMGPLSGTGTTEFRAVHDGRLYIFASEGCRRTFLARAADLVEADDPPPAWTPARVAAGRALIERAVEAVGGTRAVDSLRSYRDRSEETVTSGGAEYRVVRETWIEFPGRYRRQQTWNGDAWGAVAAPGAAWLYGPDERRDLVESQRRALERERGRHLLAILRSRDEAGTLVTHTGPGEIDGRAVEHVAVSRDGLTGTLAIDAESGRVLAIIYRGRGPGMYLGRREERLGDYRQVGPLVLPHAREVLFDGEPVANLAWQASEIAVNEPIADAVFEAPPRD